VGHPTTGIFLDGERIVRGRKKASVKRRLWEKVTRPKGSDLLPTKQISWKTQKFTSSLVPNVVKMLNPQKKKPEVTLLGGGENNNPRGP